MLIDTSIEVVLKMLFLSFSNIDIKFVKLKKLTWRTYIIIKALPTTSWVKLINKREFARVTLDENFKTFVIHITALKMSTAMFIYLFRTS